MNRPTNISVPDWNLLIKKYQDNLEELYQKINSGYPVQYLIGNVEFMGFLIKVDQRVLIPRFETEFLVSKTINYLKEMFDHPINIIDLGTGSGCIAIALKKMIDCNMTAIDISCDALEVAKNNAKINEVKINFILRDMTEKLKENYDVIISNPPYIKEGGFVEKIVKDNEPNLALYASDDGLYYYKEIIRNHISNLNKPGLMAFEIGDQEKEMLQEFLNKNIKLRYVFENDLQGLPRYLFIFNE